MIVKIPDNPSGRLLVNVIYIFIDNVIGRGLAHVGDVGSPERVRKNITLFLAFLTHVGDWY